MHRNVERGTLDQLLVVEIARMDPRRRATDPAVRYGRRNPHASEERPQRNLDRIAEAPHHTTPIERYDFHPVRWEVVRQEARAGTKVVERERSGQLKLQNADLED